ncbi:MAG: response regulator transcription factor [Bacteroidales bacterium]|nr:response regulator transcription factor [Bacteroidales bacterium]
MKKLRILLVDDHPQFINAMKFILTDSFMDKIESIDIANNGEECLEVLEKKLIDLIFMDIDMPVMNGIEATKIATATYRDIKIIALSFHTDMKYIIKMIEAGARSYIIKEEINRDALVSVFGS